MHFSAHTNKTDGLLLRKICLKLDKPNGFGTPVPFRMYLYTNNVNPGNMYLFVGRYTNAAGDIKTLKVAGT